MGNYLSNKKALQTNWNNTEYWMLRSNVGFPVMRVSETLLAGQRGFLLGDHRWTAHKLGQPWFRAGQAFAYGDAIPAFVSTLTKPPTTSSTGGRTLYLSDNLPLISD